MQNHSTNYPKYYWHTFINPHDNPLRTSGYPFTAKDIKKKSFFKKQQKLQFCSEAEHGGFPVSTLVCMVDADRAHQHLWAFHVSNVSSNIRAYLTSSWFILFLQRLFCFHGHFQLIIRRQRFRTQLTAGAQDVTL